VTVTSSSESDVEFVEERKVKPSERLHASNLPFQLDLQVVCLIGTGGYGKVFLVKSKGKNLIIKEQFTQCSSAENYKLCQLPAERS